MTLEYIIFLLPLIIIFSLLIYLQYLSRRVPYEAEISLLILTNNCQEIIEGAIKEIKSFCLLYPWCEVIIVDRFSEDDTWKILFRLAKKNNFRVMQDGPDELTAYTAGKKISSGERLYLLSIDGNSSYPKIKKRLENIKKDAWKQDYYNIVM